MTCLRLLWVSNLPTAAAPKMAITCEELLESIRFFNYKSDMLGMCECISRHVCPDAVLELNFGLRGKWKPSQMDIRVCNQIYESNAEIVHPDTLVDLPCKFLQVTVPDHPIMV